LSPVVVVHANHPREIDEHVRQALLRLAEAGVTLLNQSVLLRGVNDDARVLAELSRRLLECRTLPYYLHQLDRVAGAAHFEVPEGVGRAIIEVLRRTLPGYLVPRHVRETAGELSKQAIE
jgi:L-lysine 2,3-aminomutase